MIVISSSKSSIADKYDPDETITMSDAVRSYLHYSPKLGQRVMIDHSNVVIGNIKLTKDVSI